MRTGRKGARMRRTQISLPQEEFTAVKCIAAKRRVSMSEVVRSALRRELEADATAEDKLFSIVNLGEGTDPEGSENHDAAIYR